MIVFYIILGQTILTQFDLSNLYVLTANCFFLIRCQNGGTCNIFGSSYYCRCAPGFYGDNCQNGKFLMLQSYRKKYFNLIIICIMLYFCAIDIYNNIYVLHTAQTTHTNLYTSRILRYTNYLFRLVYTLCRYIKLVIKNIHAAFICLQIKNKKNKKM